MFRTNVVCHYRAKNPVKQFLRAIPLKKFHLIERALVSIGSLTIVAITF